MELVKKSDINEFLVTQELSVQDKEKFAKKSKNLDSIMVDITDKNYQVHEKKKEAIITVFNKCYNFLGVINNLPVSESKKQPLITLVEEFFTRFPELVTHVEYGKRAVQARKEYERYASEVRNIGNDGDLSIEDKVAKLKRSELLQKYLDSEHKAKKQLHLLQRQDAVVAEAVAKYDFYDFIDLVEAELIDKMSSLIVELNLPRECVAELKSCYQRFDQASEEQIKQMSKYQEEYAKYLTKYGLKTKNRRPVQEFGSTLKLYNPNLNIETAILENELHVEDVSKLKMPPGYSYDLINQSIIGPYLDKYVPVKVKSMQKPQSKIPGFRYITPEELFPAEESLTVSATPAYEANDYLIDEDLIQPKLPGNRKKVVSQEAKDEKLFPRLSKMVKGIHRKFTITKANTNASLAKTMASLTSWFMNKTKIISRNLEEKEKVKINFELNEIDTIYQDLKSKYSSEDRSIESETPADTYSLDDILDEFRAMSNEEEPEQSRGGR